MTTLDMIDRLTVFTPVLANLLVFGLATTAYQTTRKRSLLFIAICCAIEAVFAIGRWVLDDTASWLRWGAYTLAMNVSSGLWLVGCWLLFRDYVRLLGSRAQPGASPNGGPATLGGNSGVIGGPPSVS